jgi:hypothetical protein
MSRILALLFGIIGAVGASQAPEFSQQYRQGLANRADQLTMTVERFDDDARDAEMSRDEMLGACLADERVPGQPSCKRRGEDVADYEHATRQLAEFEAASMWTRPIVVARDPHRRTLEVTARNYEPAVPATPAGAAYAAAGFALLWGIAAMLFGMLGRLFGRY